MVMTALAAQSRGDVADTLSDTVIDEIASRTPAIKRYAEDVEAALATIIDHACDEAVGEVVSRIRQAEGVDTVAVDAALGVEPDEDELLEKVEEFGTD